MPKPVFIRGTDNSETIPGTLGNDFVLAGGGDDLILGFSGDDWLNGGQGDDTFVGGAGADTMLGGAGRDLVDYSQESGGGGVIVNLHGAETREYADGLFIGPDTAFDTYGDTDTVSNIQDVIGTQYADIIYGGAHDNHLIGGDGGDLLFGDDGDDTLEGGAGDDVFTGGAGADTLFGGPGRDRVDYREEGGGGGVIVNLHGAESREYADGLFIGPDTAFDTFGDTDTLDNIQDVIGTQYADIIYGGTHDNHLVGGAGDDELYGDAGDDLLEGGTGSDRLGGGPGADTIIGGEDQGGADVDRLGYQAAGSGVTVTFTGSESGAVIDGGGSTDTFSEIELVFGSTFDDVFYGSVGSANTFIGLQGDDAFYGNGGDNNTPDTVDYSRDELFGATHGVIVNQSGSNSVTLDDNTILAADSAIDSFGDTDILPGVRNVIGTDFADIFYGGEHANELRGRGGDDEMFGFGGADRLFGGDGSDSLNGGDGGDRLDGNAGADTLTGGAGDDRFVLDSATEGAGNSSPDAIVDFAAGDKLLILASEYGLTAGATLTANQFTLGTQASTGEAQFFYDASVDILYWDADGVAGGHVAIASFATNLTLSSSDFLIV